ncbi:acyltransferase family protein [Rhodococcus kronopolitis]|uniref:Acyltransferase family protein n=1 Tax=Rhodococcus kronopolitis TaxID=1460226 RepID=A0ABV9FLF7_9NOCA
MSVQTTTDSTLGIAHRESRPAPVHRHDLDGLRGLAIGLVVVYHVWFGRVSGGVDIFLALSGFFFVGSLLRTAESRASLDPRPVVRRVARRLLPPLVLVLAAAVVFTLLAQPATLWFDTARQTVASLLFLQNWHLAETASDYLAADPSVSPLQHLWSISVQGQFYLAAVAVVFTLAWFQRSRGRSIRRPLAALLAVLAAVSLVYATTSALPQTWLYYDSGARMWELLAGGLLACVAHRVRVPRQVGVALAVVALAIIFGCGMLLEGRSQFPGPWALVPVGAALALIVSGAHAPTGAAADPVTRMLTSTPLLRLGTVAYSLYLWHWPLLIGYLVIRHRTTPGLLGGAAVIAASLVLAELTTRLVETPIRRASGGGRRRTALVTAITVLAATVATSTVTWSVYVDHKTTKSAQHGELDPALFPGAAALTSGAVVTPAREQPSRLVAYADVPDAAPDGCMTQPGQVDALTCTYGDPDAERSIALIGGSHAEHWLPALDVLARDHPFRIEVFVKVGCPAKLPIGDDGWVGECEEWTLNVLAALSAKPVDFVVSTSTRPRDDGPGDQTPENYVALWRELADRGVPFVGIRDTPWLSHEGVKYRAADCLSARGGDADTCGIDRGQVLAPVDPAREAAEQLPSVHLLDLSDAVCGGDRCRVVEGNVLIYRDADHLTATYVRTMAPELGRQLGPATGWW